MPTETVTELQQPLRLEYLANRDIHLTRNENMGCLVGLVGSLVRCSKNRFGKKILDWSCIYCIYHGQRTMDQIGVTVISTSALP